MILFEIENEDKNENGKIQLRNISLIYHFKGLIDS